MLKGNHELMMEGYLQGKIEPREELTGEVNLDVSWFDNLWFDNGGLKTYRQLKERSSDYIISLYDYIADLPMTATFCFENKSFILVHAGMYIPSNSSKYTLTDILEMQNEDTLLWNKKFALSEKKLDGHTIICGHTPTITIANENDYGSILHTVGKILVDCGAVFDKYNGRLGCLRLDDMEEYYI